MHFRSVADLNKTILSNLHRFPSDIDLVVGIPRSGLMAASLVALALNLPLADFDGFLEGRVLASGLTRKTRGRRRWEDLQHVLVVDDSLQSGRSMAQAREKLAQAGLKPKVTFCAIYGVETGDDAGAELILERVGKPRVFEWNVMHHKVLSKSCVDIDGILCLDPERAENDDGAEYMNFLQSAKPLHAPTGKIATLVTSRLEKYRAQTVDWLGRNGVEYEELVMLDLPDAHTRRRLGAHGVFKGEYYRDSPAVLFIESEQKQAETIARISGKPVLWLPGAQMVYPDRLSVQKHVHAYNSLVRRAARKLQRLSSRTG